MSRLRNLVSLAARIVSVFRSIAIVIAIAVVFLFGVATTVYLSLRSPEVKVPDVIGKDRFEAEKILAEADLKFRVRATRPSKETNPDTVLFQLPRAGEVVKTGQTVAMDVSRVAKEGETPEKVTPDEPAENGNTNRPVNTNRPNTNANAANVNATPRSNVNRSDPRNSNTRPASNENRRPAAPRPTP